MAHDRIDSKFGVPKSTPRITSTHPLSSYIQISKTKVTYKFLLRCLAANASGWGKPAYLWLRNGECPPGSYWKTSNDGKGCDTLQYSCSRKKYELLKSKTASTPAGRYRCQVKYETKDKKTVLVCQSKPTDVALTYKIDAKTTSAPPKTPIKTPNKTTTAASAPPPKIERKKKAATNTSSASASRIASSAAQSEQFLNEDVDQHSIPVPYYCHAFWPVDPGPEKLETMTEHAMTLIEADWNYQQKYASQTFETQFVQRDVLNVLDAALDRKIETTKRSRTIQADGAIYATTNKGKKIAVGIIEIKPRKEQQGKAAVQAMVYARNASRETQGTDATSAEKALPVVVVHTYGKRLEMGAMMSIPTEGTKRKIHYTPISSVDFSDQLHVMECAKFLFQLKDVVDNLVKMWSMGASCMKFEEGTSRPLPCDCVGNSLGCHLKFTGFLTRRVFFAKFAKKGDEKQEDVVVKFSPGTYGFAAHKVLSDAGLAPKLLIEKAVPLKFPGTCYVIVMEKIDKKFSTLNNAYLTYTRPKKVKMKSEMERALTALHSQGLVHGDFRPPNIFVSTDGNVKIIDFEWSGKEKVKRYPDVNVELNWPEGVKRGAYLLKSHDLHFFRAHCIDIDYVWPTN